MINCFNSANFASRAAASAERTITILHLPGRRQPSPPANHRRPGGFSGGRWASILHRDMVADFCLHGPPPPATCTRRGKTAARPDENAAPDCIDGDQNVWRMQIAPIRAGKTCRIPRSQVVASGQRRKNAVGGVVDGSAIAKNLESSMHDSSNSTPPPAFRRSLIRTLFFWANFQLDYFSTHQMLR